MRKFTGGDSDSDSKQSGKPEHLGSDIRSPRIAGSKSQLLLQQSTTEKARQVAQCMSTSSDSNPDTSDSVSESAQ